MKSNFSIDINVKLDVTSALAKLVLDVLTHNRDEAEAPIVGFMVPDTDEAPAEVATPQAEGLQPAAKVEEAPAEEAPAVEDKPKVFTEEDVRAAMHRTRQRIEGEDYKDNTDSEGYKKYHKLLTKEFKTIAALLGSDKPSGLPADKRESFINSCDDLYLDGGVLASKVPY